MTTMTDSGLQRIIVPRSSAWTQGHSGLTIYSFYGLSSYLFIHFDVQIIMPRARFKHATLHGHVIACMPLRY